ncbi:MAG: hypothetical protein RSC00_02305 [Ruthenibacterium sp.]
MQSRGDTLGLPDFQAFKAERVEWMLFVLPMQYLLKQGMTFRAFHGFSGQENSEEMTNV